MFGLIASVISFFAGLLGLIPKGPSTQEQLGAAHEDIKALEEQNVQLEKGAAADSAATVASVLRDPGANRVTTDPTAPVNNLPGETFRD